MSRQDDPPARPDFSAAYGASSTRAAMALLQQKWVLPVVGALLAGPRGFNEVLRAIGGAGRATLAARLVGLERLGLLVRTVQSLHPPRTRYELTVSGQALEAVLAAIETWATRHAPPDPEAFGATRGEGRPLWMDLSDAFQEKWALQVMCELVTGPRGFNELGRALGVNVTTLAQRLARLEALGVLTREVLSEIPPKTRYSASAAGLEFGRVLDAIVCWGHTHLPPQGTTADEQQDERQLGPGSP